MQKLYCDLTGLAVGAFHAAGTEEARSDWDGEFCLKARASLQLVGKCFVKGLGFRRSESR